MGTTKDIRDAVEAELEFDPLVDDADIHAVNIDGDVALNGTVPSYPQYLEAAAAAQRVAGVRKRQHGDAARARPHLGRTRRGGRAPRGWPAASSRSVTTSTSPADQATAGRRGGMTAHQNVGTLPDAG